MGVSEKETEYVAHLARLGLSEDEKGLFTEQLNNILSYVDVVNSVDTHITRTPIRSESPRDNIKKQTHMRQDGVAVFDNSAGIMKNAPESEENMFKVPKILETQE